MTKKAFLAALLITSVSAFADLPKVAVLDAVLPKEVEKNVSTVVTEKISEQLVSSGKYTVLDRTTVGQSLKEIEFQMSGLVSDAEIKKAGQLLNSRLGASFVVVIQVSVVSGTYFVSAKMIDVATGEITAQASDEEEGKASVTMQIAQRVGSKLAEGAKTPQGSAQPAAASTTASATSPAASAPPAGQGAQRVLADAQHLPKAAIKINGNFDDWKDIQPAFVKTSVSNKGGLYFDKVYLAVDFENLYMRIDIDDATAPSFFRPYNFQTNRKDISYGLDMKYGAKWLVFQVIYGNFSGSTGWSVQTGTLNSSAGGWQETGRSVSLSLKGSSLEASIPLDVVRKNLGELAPSSFYKITPRIGYQGDKSWITCDNFPEKRLAF